MAPKRGLVGNTVETFREPVRIVAKDVKEQVLGDGEFTRDVNQMLYGGSEAVRSKQELDALERRESMGKHEGFRQARQELDEILGRVTPGQEPDEGTLDYVQKEEKRLGENLTRFQAESRDTAQDLGQTPQNVEAQQEQQKKVAEDQEEQAKKEQEQARLENVVEAPAGPSHFKNTRRHHPRRGTPRATKNLRSAEAKIGQGIGG